VKSAGGGTEAIGTRIVEIPENLERIELRDPSLGFIAYVPKGSVAKGKKLVDSGNGAFPAPRVMARTCAAAATCRAWRAVRLAASCASFTTSSTAPAAARRWTR